MKILRALLVLALFAGTGVVATHTTATSSPLVIEAPCDASALSAAFSGPLMISSVQNYGCENGWAFLWATIGTGAHAIGVTEIVRYDQPTDKWRVAKRETVCSPRILPHDIYELGCFSN